VEQHSKVLIKAIKNNDDKIAALSSSVKKASQESRKACNDVSQAVLKLDKTINLDKMLRIADTMERIANAMNALALIEQSGKLDRIIKAIK